MACLNLGPDGQMAFQGSHSRLGFGVLEQYRLREFLRGQFSPATWPVGLGYYGLFQWPAPSVFLQSPIKIFLEHHLFSIF